MNNANEMMVQAADVGVDGLNGFNGASISTGSWLSNQNKLEHLHELRVMALGNAKVLYGVEKYKFYDIIIAYSEPDAKFAAILVCIFNEATKILRKEIATCPIVAARTIVYGLQKDSGLLLNKYNVGDQLFGQQGGIPADGIFGLYDWKRAVNDPTQDQDDTSTLVRGGGMGAPIGPRADRTSYKRARRETDRGDYWDRDSEGRESEGRLRYYD